MICQPFETSLVSDEMKKLPQLFKISKENKT